MTTMSNLTGTGMPGELARSVLGRATAASLAFSAAGSAQGDAAAITRDFTVVTTTATGAGVILPANGQQVQVTDEYVIANYGANALLVYPPTGGKIANGTANAGFSVGVGKTAKFINIGSGNWLALLSA